MPRNISPAALTQIATHLGGEPIMIVEVFWAPNEAIAYSDKAVPELGLVGKLLEVQDIEGVININTGSNSQAVTIKLDDTDGQLKSIINNIDIHNKFVFIYQWFRNLPLSEKFLIFEGVINTPITWREGDRTLTFEVISKLEDNQVGFSVEDGTFLNVPEELLGKAWPLAFGTVVNMPMLLIDRVPTGAIKVPIGIPSRQWDDQLSNMECQNDKQLAVANCLSQVGADLQFQGDLGGLGQEVFDKGTQFQQRAEDIRRQIADKSIQDLSKMQTVRDSWAFNLDLRVIPVINGFKFAQNRAVSVRIGDAHYFGIFHGDLFHVISRRGPFSDHTDSGTQTDNQDESQTEDQDTITVEDPQSKFLENALFGDANDDDFFTSTDQDKKEDPCAPPNLIIIDTGFCDKVNKNKEKKRSDSKEGQPWFGQAGTVVKPDGPVYKFWYNPDGSLRSEQELNANATYPIRYVANIIPGTQVLHVSAMRSFKGVKELVVVPKNYYRVYEQKFGNDIVDTETGVVYEAITATIVEMHFPPDAIEGEDWGNELYVTLRSPIGPNTVDEMKYIIHRWAPHLSVDSTSFNQVKTFLSPFPSHFALIERKNIMDVLKEMSYQARCMIWLSNGVFYLKYLPYQEPAVATFTESDIEGKSLELGCTRTEDIVTQYVASWKPDLSKKDPNKLILMNNINKFGLHKKEVNYYIYNHRNEVEASAMFWILRLSNSFKTLTFKTFLTKLNVEALDTVTLAFSNNYVANGNVPALVERAQFNSSDFSIEMDLWVPVRFSEMSLFHASYPASQVHAVYATPDEEAGQFPGSQFPNKASSGNLVHPFGVKVNVVRTNTGQPITRDTVSDAGHVTGDIGTTVLNYAAIGGGSGNPGGDQAPAPKPRQDTQNTSPKELPRPKLAFDQSSVPGQIVSKNGSSADFTNGQEYQVNCFPDGPAGKSVQVKAVQLQIDTNEQLTANDWVIVTRQVVVTPAQAGGTPKVQAYYLIQAPVWT